MPVNKDIIRPTDEEILAYDNVPVSVAARYIGMSTASLYDALRDQRAPFGFASCHKSQRGRDTWTYNISPGLLIGYHAGTMSTLNVTHLNKLICEELHNTIGGKQFIKLIIRGLEASCEEMGSSA